VREYRLEGALSLAMPDGSGAAMKPTDRSADTADGGARSSYDSQAISLRDRHDESCKTRMRAAGGGGGGGGDGGVSDARQLRRWSRAIGDLAGLG
jgi:hypothetical protein